MIGLYLKKLVLPTASFSGHKVKYKGDFPVVFACVPDTIARSAHTDMCCKITPAILCSAFYWTYFYMTINLRFNLYIVHHQMACTTPSLYYHQKTKVMVVQRGGGTCHLVVDDVEVEAVQTTKYLGAMFNDEASCDDEIENRIGTATRMVGALRRQVIERKELSKATKLRVINAMVVPTLLYGSETWTLQKRHRSKIQAMEMRYLRRIEGVSRLDRIPNEDIRRRLGVEAVLAVADRKKKEWRERIEGMSQERLVRRVFEEDVCGRRPRGRPRKKWIDDME